MCAMDTELVYYSPEETMGQAKNPKWFEARKGRLTASRFYDICHTRNKFKMRNKIKLNHLEDKSGIPAIAYGMDMEPYVFDRLKDYFEEVEHSTVTECGLFIHPTHQFLAATPDGLIGDNTVLEIKCPYSIIDSDTLPSYLTQEHDTDLYQLDKSHRYYYQIQGELMCTGRKYAVLAVYHKLFQGDRIYLSCIEHDPVFCDKMTQKLIDFYYSYFIDTK